MKKTLKAVALVTGLTLLSAPVASFTETSVSAAVQYKNQWVKKGTYWTYYNSKGALQKGWLLLNNKWYFFDANGYMKTGWVKISQKWYYFDASGAMKTGWQKISNQWYFFDASGVMKTGWVKSGADWYYLNSNGAMKTGWLQTGGKWYFLERTSGKMLLGWQDIDGKTYYFYSTGGMAVNTTIEGIQIGADGAVITVDPALENVSAIAAEYGVTVEYDAELGEYSLYHGEEYIGGFAEFTAVYGEPAYGEMFKKIALEIGVPATEAELNELIAQATATETGELITENIYILIDESIYVIAWGE